MHRKPRALILLLLSILGACLLSAETPSYLIDTLAGTDLSDDGGPALSTLFANATGVAVDLSGNLYIADVDAHRIRKVTPDGMISTVAGTGTAGFGGDGGPATLAAMNMPYDVAVDRNGNLFIADFGNARVRVVSPEGVIRTFAGGGEQTAGQSGIPALDAQFRSPRNVATDRFGNVYLSDFEGHRVYRVDINGSVIAIAGTGTPGLTGDDGPAAESTLAYPAGIAVGPFGDVYLADSGNGRIRKISGGNVTTVRAPSADGSSLPLPLGTPSGVAVDAHGRLYIADPNLWTFAPDGKFAAISGLSGRGIALDSEGALYVASGNQVSKLAPESPPTIIAGGTRFRGDGGPAAAALLNHPTGVVADSSGNVFLTDQGNQRIRQVTPDGTIFTAAGDGNATYSGDFGPAVYASLSAPAGLTLSSAGRLYIADSANHRLRAIEEGTINTLAGTDTPGSEGDGGPAIEAQLDTPTGVATDGSGNIYIADAGANRIRKIEPSGYITTVAGTGVPYYSGDGGPATTAELKAPRGIAVDSSGVLYIADTGNHRIRRVALEGTISNIAGTGAPGFSGDEGPATSAQIQGPVALFLDSAGSLFIADTGNDRIRMVDKEGIIHTIGGGGGSGFCGDNGPALSACLSQPSALALDSAGVLYIADTGNQRIRRLHPSTGGVSPVPAGTITNGASFAPGSVAPGQIVSIFGTVMGPNVGVGTHLDSSGLLATQLGETQVLFDGEPAPLFFVQANQVNAQVPYSVKGRNSTLVEVRHRGGLRASFSVAVADVAPGVFTYQGGTGQLFAINADGSLNGRENPAVRGGAVTFYATGEGETDPVGFSGRLAAQPYAKPLQPVSLRIGDYDAAILYAGSAPGFAGLLQVNALVPAGFAPAGILSLTLKVGSATSQPGVTIAVR